VNTDIILITQDTKNLDSRFSRLIQYRWTFKDMQRFTMPVLGPIWPFKQIVQNKYDYNSAARLEQHFVFKDQLVFDAYDTDSLLRPLDVELEFVTPLVLEKVSASEQVAVRATRFRSFFKDNFSPVDVRNLLLSSAVVCVILFKISVIFP